MWFFCCRVGPPWSSVLSPTTTTATSSTIFSVRTAFLFFLGVGGSYQETMRQLVWKSKISFVSMTWLLGGFDGGEISGFLSLGSAWHWNSFLSVCACKCCHVQSWVRICAYLQLFLFFLPCGILTVGVWIAAFFMLRSVHHFSKQTRTQTLSRREGDHKSFTMVHWSDDEVASYFCTMFSTCQLFCLGLEH